MTLQIEAMPVPLRIDGDGVIRVGQTRIPIDTVVVAYGEGETPEQIVDSFPALRLADVYAVISFYLEHRESIDAYLHRREVEAAAIRHRIDSTPEYQAWRERMLARVAKAEHAQVSRFLADENFKGAIVAGLVARPPGLDILRVQDLGLSGIDDPQLLAWAAEHDRILLTHDVNTVPN